MESPQIYLNDLTSYTPPRTGIAAWLVWKPTLEAVNATLAGSSELEPYEVVDTVLKLVRDGADNSATYAAVAGQVVAAGISASRAYEEAKQLCALIDEAVLEHSDWSGEPADMSEAVEQVLVFCRIAVSATGHYLAHKFNTEPAK